MEGKVWKSNIRLLLVLFVVFAFVSCQPYSKNSFEPKQSETHEIEINEEKTPKDSICLSRDCGKPSTLLEDTEPISTPPKTENGIEIPEVLQKYTGFDIIN